MRSFLDPWNTRVSQLSLLIGMIRGVSQASSIVADGPGQERFLSSMRYVYLSVPGAAIGLVFATGEHPCSVGL